MPDVLIRGAGFAGLLVARGLIAAGVDVVVVDPRGPLSGASGGSLGVVLPCHAEHPHRTFAALGDEAGVLFEFYRRSFGQLPGFMPGPIRWVESWLEAGQLGPSCEAARSLGLPAEPTADGYRMWGGGTVDLRALAAALSAVPVRDEVPDELAWEIEVLAGGPAILDPWLADKLLPVRLQGARFEGPAVAEPIVSQHTMLRVSGNLATGGRGATAHFEVGETEPVVQPAVTALLSRGAHHLVPAWGAPLETWAGIVAEPCDGLPIVGAVPGRPRTLVLAGLSVNGLSAVAACADALVAGITRGEERLPPCLRAARM